MKHVKLFEHFINEGASIFSDSTDKEITLRTEVELIDGRKAKVLAIPDKSNPKYKKGIIVVSAERGGNREIDINKDIKNVINEASILHAIGRDAENLVEDLKKKGIITKGDVSGNAPRSAGKLNIEIYPVVDTSKNLDKLFPEMNKHYENLGRSETGKMTYKFASNLYGWLWNEVGNSVTIVLMRKNPIK